MNAVIAMLPLLGLLIWAAVQDIRTRRIPNWLTVSLIVSGLLRSLLGTTGGNPVTVSPSQALFGLLVGFAIPFALFALGAIGGGDVKLMAGIGAWLGPMGVIYVMIAEKVIGLVVVLAQCAWNGRLRDLFRNSALVAINLAHVSDVGVKHAVQTGQSCRSVDRPLPLAVPLLAATLLVITVLM